MIVSDIIKFFKLTNLGIKIFIVFFNKILQSYSTSVVSLSSPFLFGIGVNV